MPQGMLDLYIMMGAVLAANLLTIMFFWAFWNYSKLEAGGKEKLPGAGQYLGSILFVLVFLAGAVFMAAASPTHQEHSEPPALRSESHQ